jgi:ABC-type branched-subunit amino acid transport system ATPase component/ABC-type branched-subunit amino acid transport system permease subunit
VSVALILPILPYFNTAGHRFLLGVVLLYALLGIGLTMLIGWAGQVSLGHFAIVGLAAYLTARWGPNWSLVTIVLVAGLVGATVMVVIGLPALRVGGLALAVTTMGFAVVAADWLFRQDWVGSSQPFVAVPALKFGHRLGTLGSQLSIYYVALGAVVLGVTTGAALRRSNAGRRVVAVRDNEQAASSFGVNPAGVKLAILAVSGFFAAVAGVLWAASWRVTSPSQFSADMSIAIVALPVIGGLGSIGGAVSAAAVVYGTAFFVGPHVASLFGSYGNNLGFQLFLAGIGQVVVLLSYPRGIAGLAQTQWQRFLNHRAAHLEGEKPEVVADVARAWDDGGDIEQTLVEAAAERMEPFADEVAANGENAAEQGVALLVTQGIHVRFGGVVALNEPDIRVDVGEIVGLIGPNGAGKTTLISVISGVLRPERGSVQILGHEVADLPPDFRAAYGVARTFQDARLFGGLTVGETIQVALSYRDPVGMVSALTSSPWARAAEWRTRDEAERIATRFGLDPWLDTLTSELSTGTRRICDLAAQVAARPRLLLLDEPTGGVAQREAEAFTPLLRRVRDDLDCAVLIVEHDMPLLMGLCDRVYAMESGSVIAEGTPEETRNNPAVVESYLGTNESAVGRSGRRPASAGPVTRV